MASHPPSPPPSKPLLDQWARMEDPLRSGAWVHSTETKQRFRTSAQGPVAPHPAPPERPPSRTEEKASGPLTLGGGVSDSGSVGWRRRTGRTDSGSDLPSPSRPHTPYPLYDGGKIPGPLPPRPRSGTTSVERGDKRENLGGLDVVVH